MAQSSGKHPFYVVEVRDHLTRFYNLPCELPARDEDEVVRIQEEGYDLEAGLAAMQWVIENRPDYEHVAAYRRFLLKWPIMNDTRAAITTHEFETALICLDALVTLDDEDPSAHYHLGLVYRYIHKYLLSESSLRTCLGLYPELAIGHRALGFTLAYLDRKEEAIAELKKALIGLPDDPDTLRALREIRAH